MNKKINEEMTGKNGLINMIWRLDLIEKWMLNNYKKDYFGGLRNEYKRFWICRYKYRMYG